AGNTGLVDDRAVSTPSIRIACSWGLRRRAPLSVLIYGALTTREIYGFTESLPLVARSRDRAVSTPPRPWDTRLRLFSYLAH
ncbi:MAG: hypothetical protein ACOCSQ_01605, partial [Planctomycetota bacterium]